MEIGRFGFIFVLLGLLSCATLSIGERESQDGPYFENPPSHILFSDMAIFNQALSLQYKGQLKSAIGLWQKYLSENTNSFEAYNNLGMAFYSNDELGKAISAFQSALGLQIDSKRIQKNLRRTLLFRVTLSKENREFSSAIRDLEKISNLSSGKDKERLLREIEDIQEKIFDGVKRINTVAEYQNFLSQYPSSIYADKARKSLKMLSPDLVPEDLEKPKEFLPVLIPESGKVLEESLETENVKN